MHTQAAEGQELSCKHNLNAAWHPHLSLVAGIAAVVHLNLHGLKAPLELLVLQYMSM
jgi:hypothetical protein